MNRGAGSSEAAVWTPRRTLATMKLARGAVSSTCVSVGLPWVFSLIVLAGNESLLLTPPLNLQFISAVESYLLGP